MSRIRHAWPQVALSEVASPVERPEVPQIGETYRQLGVRLWGLGAYEREPIDGGGTKYRTLSKVEAGDIVVNKIWARNGSVAVVQDELAGCYVSGEFPTFAPSRLSLDPRWIHWQTRTRGFWNQCDEKSRGTSGKNRIKPERFLEVTIPLPPLSEQRRIVARIEELAAKVEEAKGLREKALEVRNALFSSAISSEWSSESTWEKKPIEDLATLVSGQVDPRYEPYASLPHISGDNIESGTGRLLPYRTAEQDEVRSGNYHFQAGSILYSKIRPYLRKAVQVPVEGVCSADVYAFDMVSKSLEPRFLMYSLIAPDFTAYANTLSGRTRMPKLNQKQLFAYQLGVPPLPEQRRIVAYLDSLQAKVDELKKLQTETQSELAALLPSILDKAFKGEL